MASRTSTQLGSLARRRRVSFSLGAGGGVAAEDGARLVLGLAAVCPPGAFAPGVVGATGGAAEVGAEGGRDGGWLNSSQAAVAPPAAKRAARGHRHGKEGWGEEARRRPRLAGGGAIDARRGKEVGRPSAGFDLAAGLCSIKRLCRTLAMASSTLALRDPAIRRAKATMNTPSGSWL